GGGGGGGGAGGGSGRRRDAGGERDPVLELDAGGLIGVTLELGHVDTGNLDLKLDFTVDHDAKQRLRLRRRYCAEHRGAASDNACGWSPQGQRRRRRRAGRRGPAACPRWV